MEYFDELIEQAPELATIYGTKILMALVIFIIGKFIANMLQRFTASLMRKRRIDDTVVSFISNMVWSVVFAFTVIATLSQFGVQTASLVAVIGAAGLAVGLALQGSLSNFAAGVLIVIFRPCRIGDYIEAALKKAKLVPCTHSNPEPIGPNRFACRNVPTPDTNSAIEMR